MSIDRRNVRALVRAVAYDAKGSRLGRVAQVFLDDRTDEPAWVAVDVTRTRGMRLLPLAGAGLKGKYLVIRADRTTVRSAPRIDLGDGQLSSQDESRLLEHYGLLPVGDPQPRSDDEAAPYSEQRPATPWPDDSHREMAWQPPLQRESQDTQVLAPSGDQPTGDRAAQSHVQSHEHRDPPAPMQQRDTAPTPTAAPGPPAPPQAFAVGPVQAPTAAPAEASTAPIRTAPAPSPPADSAAPPVDGSHPAAAQPHPGSSSPRT
ncbi:MAG: hypothetical protein H0U22_00700 [Geodermatophilaceae bacterium]|nr:hypothetical protein [Geodermatophilaceae bacterium]